MVKRPIQKFALYPLMFLLISERYFGVMNKREA